VRRFLLLSACVVSLSAAVSPEGLVLHLPFDEDVAATVAADYSGNNNNGTLRAGSAFDPTGGHLGGALVVDGGLSVPLAIGINFGLAGTEIPGGYLPDGGEPFGPRSRGWRYGWLNDVTDYARERNSSNAPDQRYDTLTHLQHGYFNAPPGVWEMELPNGRYEVHLVCGDPTYTDQINQIQVENVLVEDPDGEDHFDEYSVLVQVDDGKLTLSPGPDSFNPKLCFMRVAERTNMALGVDIRDSAAINNATVPERTVSLWFQATTPFTTTRKQILFEEGGTIRGSNIYLHDGKLYGGGWNLPTKESGWAGTWLSTTAPDDGAWHHVALVLKGGNKVTANALKLYLDGVEVASGPGSQLWPHSGDIGVGAMDEDTVFHDGPESGLGHPLSGRIDELRIFQRSLVPDEIDELLTETPQVPPPPPVPSPEPFLAQGVVTGVGSAWQRVEFAGDHSYTQPVVIATAQVPLGALPAVVRVNADDADGFSLRVQNPGKDLALSGFSVHYIVLEAGVYTADVHGVTLEAAVIDAPLTAAKGRMSDLAARSYRNSYTAPVVLGQVMSANDADWSSFLATSSNSGNPADATLRLGKHVGEDIDVTRVNERLAYLVIEAGQGQLGGLDYSAGVSADSIAGMGNNPPFSVVAEGLGHVDAAILSSAGMDGGDGGWPVLYGDSASAYGVLNMAIDEDQIRDAERSHTTEQVAWLALGSTEGGSVPPVPGGGDPSGSPKLDHGVIANLGADWQVVNLPQSYVQPVVVACPVTEAGAPPVVARVRNVTSTSFECARYSPSNTAVSPGDVHYLVTEAGVFNQSEHGIDLQAGLVVSPAAATSRDWTRRSAVAYQRSFTAPVVLGQVVSANGHWGTFFATGAQVSDPPSADTLYLGHQIAEDPRAGSPEQLAYIVFEAGAHQFGEQLFVAALGSDSLVGTGDGAVGYPYALGLDVSALNLFERLLWGQRMASNTVVASSAAIDGANGGWPVLMGPEAISNSEVSLAIDEDQLLDAERNHTTEQAAYVVVGPAAVGGMLQP
jgi:hypothetical protein